mgnify:CR=1 FL=1
MPETLTKIANFTLTLCLTCCAGKVLLDHDGSSAAAAVVDVSGGGARF